MKSTRPQPVLCPFCDSSTRKIYEKTDFRGVVIECYTRLCLNPKCKLQWLPVKEEKRIEEILKKARPEEWLKRQDRTIDRLRTRIQVIGKENIEFKKLLDEWKKRWDEYQFTTDIDNKQTQKTILDLAEDLKEAKQLIEEAIYHSDGSITDEMEPWFNKSKRFISKIV